MSVKWVFFDIGDVLFDEDAQHQYWLHSLLLSMRRNGVPVTWDAYHTELEALVRIEPGTAIVQACRRWVPDDALWAAIYREGRAEYEQMRAPRPYGMLLDNITAVVRELQASYSLGIIANQHPPIVDALHDYGIADAFRVTAIDSVVGVSKPDPALFVWALDQAQCAPRDAIMIGDRPENDVKPAKSLGMKTIRFRRGTLYSLYDPRTEAETSDLVVRVAARIPAAVRALDQT
ncbi:MAG: HAD family hydrolase [Armatimonadetes bacterium]|nr:HAD family hydrolase [Armatimonadota bacterium]MDE2207678.1 HAD family hydrolase [Armatimonadota bacterium]